LLCVLLQGSTWRSGPQFHTLLEAVATVLALAIGVITLARFYARRFNVYLLVGTGFLGTALLDGYHALVTSPLFSAASRSAVEELSPWSWSASRTYLAGVMILSWRGWRRQRKLGESGRLSDRRVYAVVGSLMAASFLFFVFAPLPRAYYPELFFGRPQELVPAFLFLVATLGYVTKQRDRRDAFETWLILSLIVSFVAQLLAISRSFQLHDAMFDLAHVLKIGSYGLVFIGLVVDVYRLFGRVENTASKLSNLNRSLLQEVEERARAEEALSTVASSLALPPRTEEVAARSYRLEHFSLTDMMTCGAAIRRMVKEVKPDTGPAPGGDDAHAAFARRLVHYLHEHMLSADGCRAFALVRLFETRRFDQLGEKLMGYVSAQSPDLAPDTRCLTLLATAGDREEWNHVESSADHQAIPLPSPTAVERLPMISQLIRQLGFQVGGILQPTSRILLRTTLGVFHVPTAMGSPHIPAQEAFVEPYGIRSVVGFGDVLADGRLFAVIMFSRIPVTAEVAALLSHLAHSTRMALLSLVEAPNKIEAQITSLDRLLANHEAIVAEQDKLLHAAVEDLRRTNAELIRSNEELDQFANVASHDLRSPLRNIENLSEWIIEDLGDSVTDRSRKHLNLLRQRIRRMDRLLHDLLQYSRVGREESRPAAVETGKLIGDIVELLHPPPQFTVRVDEKLPTVHAPPTALRRVFQNLIENAIKHCDRDEGKVEVSCRDQGDLVEFTVQDNGPGIAPQYHEKVFQIFQTLSRRDEVEASGIGLAIVKKTVEMYGGRIVVESDVGKGATFRFTWKKNQNKAEMER
jgi:signal transduction histidine kinase